MDKVKLVFTKAKLFSVVLIHKSKQVAEVRAVYIVSILWLLSLVAYYIEPIVMPAVKNFTITRAEIDNRTIFISGYFNKTRPECLFIGVVAYQKDKDGTRIHVPLVFLDSKVDHTNNRKGGFQGWGPWKLTPSYAISDSVILDVTHRCHPGWTTTTRLIELPITKQIKVSQYAY